MAMILSMQELFYGESEPAYFVHYGRQTSLPYSHAHQIALPESRMSRHMEFITFDLMVPMCCINCEDKVRDALLDLSSVKDVVCDPYNQKVTVTGYLDPAQALQQVKRVKNGATFWSGSSYSQHKYNVSSYQKSHRHQQDNRDRRSYVQHDTREKRSYPDHYNRSSSGTYSWSSCPAHRDSAITQYINVNPAIATRVEMEC